VGVRYLLAVKESSFFVAVEDEKFPRRILYYNDAVKIASEADRESLSRLLKIQRRTHSNLDTISLQKVEIPQGEAKELLVLLTRTGRAFFNSKGLSSSGAVAQVVWKGETDGKIVAWLKWRGEEARLETVEALFPGWCILNGEILFIESDQPWKWIEMFRCGPLFVEDPKKLPVVWDQSSPQLILTDATGSFANLARFDAAHEKDLLEAGFIRKTVGASHYYCPSDKAREALLLLIDVGWEIYSSEKKRVYRQTGSSWNVREEGGRIAVRGELKFQDKKAAPLKGRLFVDLDSESVGLLDKQKGIAPEGEWIGETLYVKKSDAARCQSLEELDSTFEESVSRLISGLKEGAVFEEVFPGPSFQGSLLAHQKKGLDWLSFLYKWGFSGLLADEMGLGKTVQVLAFFSTLRTKLPVLVVAPASLLYNWKAEIERFLPSWRVQIYAGEVEPQGAGIYLASYAQLRLGIDQLSQVEWEATLLDESGAIKTAQSQTARAACQLKAHFKLCLNGVPVENRKEELESQFRFLMPGLELEKSKPFILRRLKDAFGLPEKIEQTVWIEMSEEQSRLYASYVEGVRLGLLKKVAADGARAHRMEILEAILRLRQIATEPRLIGEEIRGTKIEQLLSDLEEALQMGRKVLIYSQFTKLLQLVGKELGRDYLYLDGSVSLSERAERVRRFQEGEVPLFLLSLKAGGVGLNLQMADYVFLLDPWWNEAVENQAIGRAHRIGRTQTVVAKRYIALGTIEEKILALKAAKEKTAGELLEETNWTEEDWLHCLS
jgi:superfamily II DNA or RNA helicase